MIETRNVETAPGMVFDVSVAGSGVAPLVLMLHGFGVSRHFWNSQARAVAAAGFYAAAPNQRGYAAGARPDPAALESYRVVHLIANVFAIVAALGHAGRRFHLVGHDWGASLAWQIADQASERLASLTILSRPHPLAFNRALELPDRDQRRRSGHHTTFLEPNAGPDILADDAKWLRTRLAANGVPATAVAAHLSVIGKSAAMEAALAWYRAAACDTGRPARQRFQRFISGATRMTRSAARRRRGRANSSRCRIGSLSCRGSGTMPPIRLRMRSMRCC
jgi:pimeloyl-ACP methyl ester carboxylesterase